jgi:hypothetical protein
VTAPADVVLTTNDVRVLRLLLEHGPLTEHEIGSELRYGLGAEPALRRLPRLGDRALVRSTLCRRGRVFDTTIDGVRALGSCDRAAYGRHV